MKGASRYIFVTAGFMPLWRTTRAGIAANRIAPVGALEAQATRRVLLENRQLVPKGEDLHLQAGTGPKTGGQGEKGDEKRAHRGIDYDRTNDRNLSIFRSNGVFGKHTAKAK